MAGDPITLWKNDGTSTSRNWQVSSALPSAETLGWTRDGYSFVNWNTAADGSGTSYEVGVLAPSGVANHFAQWAADSVDYIATSTDLTSVADAIRLKAEISGTLGFPSGFITAINSITGGGMTITRTPDAAGGEVLNISGTATEIESLSVTANGTYTAPSGKAYSPVTVNVSGGGGVATRLVTFTYNDATSMYYTDSTMTPVSLTSGSMDISTEMPIGTLIVYVKTASEPSPFPMTTAGVSILWQTGLSLNGMLRIYEVVE